MAKKASWKLVPEREECTRDRKPSEMWASLCPTSPTESKPCSSGLAYPTIQNKQAHKQPNLWQQLQRQCPQALARLALAITVRVEEPEQILTGSNWDLFPKHSAVQCPCGQGKRNIGFYCGINREKGTFYCRYNLNKHRNYPILLNIWFKNSVFDVQFLKTVLFQYALLWVSFKQIS